MSGYVVDCEAVEAVRADGDTASVRTTIDRAAGSQRLEQRVIHFGAGRSRPRGPGPAQQEVLYVASGRGTLHVDGEAHPLEPDAGAHVAAGQEYEVENPGPDELVVVSVVAPADGAQPAAPVVRFDERPEERADEYRTFRVLVDGDLTQFVGLVDPSRAPDHSHTYDEVGYIVAGEGAAHLDGRTVPLRAGSCFHLPPGTVHCIENSGGSTMRILGVFHPTGSPASRSYEANN
jgi:mannose-6-phosphate isomerase-like protein (cupin superfamily)